MLATWMREGGRRRRGTYDFQSDLTERGYHCSGELWRDELRPELRAALFLSTHGTAAAGQLARYAWGCDLGVACTELEKLRRRGYVDSVRNFDLPPGLDAASCDAWFLERRGLRWIARKLRGRPHRQGVLARARAGLPEGRRLATLNHALLQTELYLRLYKDNVIHRFVNEDEIYAMREMLRRDPSFYTLCATEIGEAGDTCVDCLIQFTGRDGKPVREDYFYAGNFDRDLFEEAFEILVTSGDKRVRAKPRGVTWVVCGVGKSLHVALSRPEQVIRLTSVTAHTWDAYEPGGPPTREELWEMLRARGGAGLAEILGAVEACGGAAARQAVAVMASSDPSVVSKRANRLARLGLLQAVDVSLEPGRQCGRPWRVYAVPGAPVDDPGWLLPRLLLSILRAEHRGLAEVDEGLSDGRVLALWSDDGSAVLYLADDPLLSPGEALDPLEEAFAGLGACERLRFFVCTTSPERAGLYRPLVKDTEHVWSDVLAERGSPIPVEGAVRDMASTGDELLSARLAERPRRGRGRPCKGGARAVD